MNFISIKTLLFSLMIGIAMTGTPVKDDGIMKIGEYEQKAIANHLSKHWEQYKTNPSIIKSKEAGRFHDVYWQPQTAKEKAKLVFIASNDLDGPKAILGAGGNGIVKNGLEVYRGKNGFDFM